MSDKPENKVLTFDFVPKFKPFQKVRVYQKKYRYGTVVDCLGAFTIVASPNGVVMGVLPPAQDSTRYFITFTGNANEGEWFNENMIDAVTTNDKSVQILKS